MGELATLAMVGVVEDGGQTPLAFEKRTAWGALRFEAWLKRIWIPSKQLKKNGEPKKIPVYQRFIMVYWMRDGQVDGERRFWFTFRKGALTGISDSHTKHRTLGAQGLTLDQLREELARLTGSADKAGDLIEWVMA